MTLTSLNRARWITLAALLGAALLGSPSAGAQAKRDAKVVGLAGEAKKHFELAVAKFNAGEFEAALTEFRASEDATPSADTSRLIAICLDNLGKYEDAVLEYTKFVAEPPKTKDADKQVEEVKKRIEAITKTPGKLRVEAVVKGGMLTVDGKEIGPLPQEALELAPGKHKIHLVIPGYDPIDKEIEIKYLAKVNFRLPLELKEPPPPPPKPVEKPVEKVVKKEEAKPPVRSDEPLVAVDRRVPALITGGLAIAAAGVGAGFGIAAISSKNSFGKSPSQSAADAADSHALIADVAFAAAGTLAVTTLVLVFTHPEKTGAPDKKDEGTKAASRSTVTFVAAPTITPTSAGISALFRF